MTKKILITGFGPFDKNDVNPSQQWVESLCHKKFVKRDVKGLILPVTFDECFEQFVEVYNQFQPDLVLMTGLAQNRKVLTVERIGINWIDARIPDNNGKRPLSQKITEDGPDGLFSTVDLEHLKTIWPALTLSTSAGEYVCNYLLYKVLYFLKNDARHIPATFFHLPGLDDYQNLFLELDNIVEHL